MTGSYIESSLAALSFLRTTGLRGIPGRNFTYSDEDHLLTAGSTSYQYDLDGFLTTKTDGNDVTGYNYSSRGELLSVTLPDGRIVEYFHDPLGRRIAKIVDGITVEKIPCDLLAALIASQCEPCQIIPLNKYARPAKVAERCGNSWTGVGQLPKATRGNFTIDLMLLLFCSQMSLESLQETAFISVSPYSKGNIRNQLRHDKMW